MDFISILCFVIGFVNVVYATVNSSVGM